MVVWVFVNEWLCGGGGGGCRCTGVLVTQLGSSREG